MGWIFNLGIDGRIEAYRNLPYHIRERRKSNGTRVFGQTPPLFFFRHQRGSVWSTGCSRVCFPMWPATTMQLLSIVKQSCLTRLCSCTQRDAYRGVPRSRTELNLDMMVSWRSSDMSMLKPERAHINVASILQSYAHFHKPVYCRHWLEKRGGLPDVPTWSVRSRSQGPDFRDP